MQNYFKQLLILITIFNIVFAARGQANTDYTSARTYAFTENNLIKAEELGMSAHKLAPDDIEIAHFLAKDVLMPLKKKNEAGEMFIKALSMENKNLGKKYNIGNESIETIHQEIATFAGDFYNHALDAYNKKDYNETKYIFNVALKLDPNHIESMLGLADLLYNHFENLDEALVYLDKAISLSNDEDKKLNYVLTKIQYLRKENRYESVVALLEPKINELGVMEKRQLFLTYLDLTKENNKNLYKAIDLGENLVETMIETLDITNQDITSEVGYNLAVSYRQRAMQNYNKVAEYITSEQTDLDLENIEPSDFKDILLFN